MKIINKQLLGFDRYIFLSPHLDDAIFSAGALMWELKNLGKEIYVVNIFTRPGVEKPSLSAKKFLNACGFSNAVNLFRERVDEDARALSGIAKVVNMDFVDCLWRRKHNLGSMQRLLCNFIPEVALLYPTYQLHVIRGKRSKEDGHIVEKIIAKTMSLLETKKKCLVLGPVGIGNHVDHRLVGEAMLSIKTPMAFWADTPYVFYNSEEAGFIDVKRFLAIDFGNAGLLRKKLELCKKYKSQFTPVFGDKFDMSKKERYYIINQ